MLTTRFRQKWLVVCEIFKIRKDKEQTGNDS